MQQIEKENFTKIQVAQGYTNCSIAQVSDNAAIVTDRKIAEVLKKQGIDVLCLADSLEINLFSTDGKISSMRGLIGGAMARIGDKMILFGDLRMIDTKGEIRKFVENYQLEMVDFEGLDVMDYGGILEI